MKKKGFCFKRVISLLLTAVMILTAAPQTGMTAFATENSDSSENPQVLSEDDTFADAESNENDADGDTAQPEDGQEESGDGSEDDGDVPPDESGDKGSSDDTEEPGEVTDPGEEQEGGGEDTADIVSEEETVSENTLGAELMEDNAPEGEEELGYKGDVIEDEDDGWKYNRLVVSAFEDGGLSDDRILEILAHYADQGQKFECVQLDMQDTNSKNRKIKSDILNAVVAVLKTDAKDAEGNPRYWIDYNLSNENEWRNFALDRPQGCEGDIDINVTMTPVAGLGVKLKFPAVNFPAEDVSVNVGGDNMKDLLAASLVRDRDVEGDYGLFTMASGKPVAYVSRDEDGYELGYEPAGSNDSEGKDIHVGNIGYLEANTEYLMAFVADDGEIAAGETKQLTPPVGGSATWKSYMPDIVSIDASGKLSAWDEGEALYSVTYKEGNASKTKFYRMYVTRKLYSMKFETETLTMELDVNAQEDDPDYECTEHLELLFYPSDAGNPDEIDWEITKGEDVISFVLYDENGDKDENNGHPNGEIVALKSGEATVTATYLKDTTITAECKITVKAVLNEEEIENKVKAMDLYAVSGCDMTLGDLENQLDKGWKWVHPEQSLAPFAGTEGHDFAAKYTDEDGKSAQATIWVRMINVNRIFMTSWQHVDPDESEGDPAGQSDADEEISNMQWVEGVPDSLTTGDELKLSFDYELENCDDGYMRSEVEKKLQEKYAIEWSSNPKDQLQEVDSAPEQRKFTASTKANKPEKKTFTVSMKDKKTKKVVWKASHTLTVTTKDLFDWEIVNENLEDGNPEEEWVDGKLTSLTFTVKMKEEEYNNKNNKLTFASMDTSILQLKKETASGVTEDGTPVTKVKVPCTQKSTGRVWIKVTAPDEMKSYKLFSVELPDKEPKLVGSASFTINKAATDHFVPIYLSTHERYPLVENGEGHPVVTIEEIKTGGTDAKASFELKNIEELSKREAAAILEGENSDNGGVDFDEPYIGLYGMELGLKGALSGVKAGNYTVKLSCSVKGRDKDSEPEKQTVSFTVKVTDVKPKVTFKQTKKVNLFYTDAEGAGTLQVNTDEEITELLLEDYTDSKNPSKNAVCGYEVQKNEESGSYEIVRKSGSNGKLLDETMKKGILKYKVEGYAEYFPTVFTVATEIKAPVIVLSAKSDTLYPGVWYTDSWITMTDKATGEAFELDGQQEGEKPGDKVHYVVKGRNGDKEELSIGEFSEEVQLAWKDIAGSSSGNQYGLFVTDDGNIVSRLREIDPKNGKKADTLNLEVQKKNWTKPVAVSYKLQVDSTLKPKLELGKATLTLNKNDEIYRGQQERTSLRLKGCGNYIMQDDNSWVSITGQDDKSKAELKGKDSSLVIWYQVDRGDVFVRFNDNKIDAGTYKFKISVSNEDVSEYASTVLTVKIVDKTVKQSLKVSAKGSIDVMDREGTFIAYTPKLSNLTGTVEDGWLEGRDADLFENYFEDGKLIVKARGGTVYSTKNTYEVHTVFQVQNKDGRSYEISSDNDPKAKPFKITVKQGKPKLKVTTNGNTIYRQRNNRVEIRIEAMLGKQEVEIEDVWLLNYRGDLELIPTKIKVEDEGEGEDGEDVDINDILSMADNYQEVIYNPQTKSVRVALCDSWGLRDISKNGTYKVNFAVRYRDKAGDVKEAEVTCPIVVR